MSHELTSHIKVHCISVVLVIFILESLVFCVLLGLDVFLVALSMLGLLLGVGSKTLLISTDKFWP